MIVEITSSIPTFKTMRLHPGLNVILADTGPEKSERRTRNSAGKTSFVEIVHFLLGANCDKESLFRTQALISASFKGTFLILGQQFTVERTGSDPSKIFILEGTDPKLTTKTEKASGRAYVSNNHWRVFLGFAFFKLPMIAGSSSFDEPGAPSFRSMFSYFARRENSGAFLEPERQSEKQQRGDWQVQLSYLLSLDWEIALGFQNVRNREGTLSELKRAAKLGTFGDVVGTVAELRPQVTIAEAQAKKLRDQLSNFEVLESYKEYSRRAARAKTEMQSLAREAVVLNETLDHLRQAFADEKPPSHSDIDRIYAAAGVELPDVALRRLSEVSDFYSSMIENRRGHLKQEIDEATRQLSAGERRIAALDNERRQILASLEGRGALEDFLGMQRDLATIETQAASLRERYKTAELLEGKSTQLDIDRVNLKRRLQEDFRARKEKLDEAIILVAETISSLYEDRTGRFVVEATENGPDFHISIEGDRGGGISKMEIFCLDLTLFKLAGRYFGGPHFLIHDSHMFDGVDERQVATALALGQRAANDTESQYIVAMNSDIFDRLPFSEEIDTAKAILPTRLSDEAETGGIFGFRFS